MAMVINRPSVRPIGTRGLANARIQAPVHSTVARSLGKDAVDGWLDVMKLVSGSTGPKSPYDELATTIGKECYVDIAGWHLYLRDMNSGAPNVKMSTALAQQFGPQASKGLRESDVVAVLKRIPVKLGAGRTQVSLYDVSPSFCVADLTRILEDWGRK